MKEHEPELFEKIAKIMLPKDYLAYKLSGTFCTEYSDASGMLLLDVQNKCWSKEMLDICGIREEQLPKLYESYEVVGNLKPEIAEELRLGTDVKVIAGAGDNAAAAVGTGNRRRRSVQYFPWNFRHNLYIKQDVRCGSSTMRCIHLHMQTAIII